MLYDGYFLIYEHTCHQHPLLRPTSCSSSCARLELENAKLQSLNKAILLGDTIPNFDALKEKLSAETWPEGFLYVNKGNYVQFYYIMNDNTSEPLQLIASVIITKELALRTYVQYTELFYHFTSTNIFYHQNISKNFHS